MALENNKSTDKASETLLKVHGRPLIDYFMPQDFPDSSKAYSVINLIYFSIN
jgi:hypothetical protein